MKDKFFKYAPIVLFLLSSAIWLIAYLLHDVFIFALCIINQIAILICCGIIMNKLHQQVIRDSLTGLYNRRSFVSKLSDISKVNLPVSLLMIDIDNFKRINDTYGHLAGDEILKQISDILTANTRHYDWVARLGGEEFAVVLPQSHPDEALKLAGRLNNMVKGFAFPIGTISETLTISIGVTTTNMPINVNSLIQKADKALYEAKETRNTVIVN